MRVFVFRFNFWNIWKVSISIRGFDLPIVANWCKLHTHKRNYIDFANSNRYNYKNMKTHIKTWMWNTRKITCQEAKEEKTRNKTKRIGE